ncbi:M23 family metallopeptidase [Paenibacillus psychroresistens]|uniref:M23 family metallopeptidase n=1 Tax=Paenibacillus psychroresistens TaxID=1778678 RepID=A0A6B8RVE4_9BACL|nr:M23 family metallopeptidase [Paenibacillus psychroresistens]QGQ99842.1 M23 family metallopeptidase [Paenibacillus psychroresistens]
MNFFKGAHKLRTKLQQWTTQTNTNIKKINWKENIQSKFRWMAVGNGPSLIKKHRMLMIKSVGSLGLIAAITVGGNHYVNANMVEVYHVYVDGKEAGSVSSPQLVDDFKVSKVKELKEKNPNVHMVVNIDAVTLKPERAFKIASEDTATLHNLDTMLTVRTLGIELVVDGKLIGTVRDKAEADAILDRIKAKYLPSKAKAAGKVGILSAQNKDASSDIVDVQVEKADFVQKVDINEVDIDANALMDPDKIVAKLETGDVQPKKYKVMDGDCVSCIAAKFDISPQLIYTNNPVLVEDDRLQIGQVLDLTLLEPTLSVRTVERVIENQEIQFETNYKLDDSMRAGIVKKTKSGVNGMKKVTIELTKLNGFMEDEKMLSEEVTVKPQAAEAIRGTKVILGEGTGKFAWPVVGSSLSSGFGTRWGVFHKGVDLTSGNRSILAADNGKVIYAGYKSDYGNHIIIDHLNGYKTLYGHLSKIGVTVGTTVEKGEKIGVMGSTGDSTGTHLHFEVRSDDSPQNPLKYLNR